jgi:hypothetical protein
MFSFEKDKYIAIFDQKKILKIRMQILIDFDRLDPYPHWECLSGSKWAQKPTKKVNKFMF